ncbi:MAG TPA: PIG-L family deacetylase [Candidatus Koribacter sp.]|jgi:LmbE family N-acetylglucosaminyl deacetylase
MRRILVVTAHPDDEVGGFGGTLLKYREMGVETYVICLTAGEAATHRGHAKTDEELAEMRRAEFAASCNELKISHGWVLEYRDGGLDRENGYRVIADLVQRIREIRPQVLLTYGPEGSVTGHPDHSMASMYATLAAHWAGRTNRFADQFWTDLKQHRVQKLYYQTATFFLPDRQPVSPSPVSCQIEVSQYLEDKIRAFRQHSSQQPLFENFELYLRKKPDYEFFHLAASTDPRNCEMETDLFAGIKD